MTEIEQSASLTSDEIDLTNIRELRNFLYAHHIRPNKAFGQNFLVDRDVLLHIVDAAEIQADDQVLELGAGTGVLTRELAKRAQRVVAVELEREMLSLLAKTTHTYTNVEIMERNLLYVDPKEVLDLSRISWWRIYHIISRPPHSAIFLKAPIHRDCS